MTCCIVGLLILLVVGRLRRAVGGPVDEPVLFAPVARRAAPGQTLPEPLTRQVLPSRVSPRVVSISAAKYTAP